MCGFCCKELKGWCQSFTKTETFLSILEALLLVIFIAFLTFVVLHFIACSKKEVDIQATDKYDNQTDVGESIGPATVAPGVECTWVPDEPTKAGTRYYEQRGNATTPRPKGASKIVPHVSPMLIENKDVMIDLSDGDDATSYEKYILALVKMRPPQDVTFGCILTIVSEYWAVTAASCIEAIEEVDSLDSFVMLEGYGGGAGAGAAHSVADVRLHPWYQGRNRSYDLVALKSEDKLVGGSRSAAEMSDLLDFFLTPIGEQLTILGFGRYRGMDPGPAGRRLRRARTWLVSSGQCGAGDERWAPRHLRRPQSASAVACGARALCAGPLEHRSEACNYCAGAPLWRAGRLLAVMAERPQCGAACDPALYVALPQLRNWLDSVIAEDDFLP